jgi:hypothetical protein
MKNTSDRTKLFIIGTVLTGIAFPLLGLGIGLLLGKWLEILIISGGVAALVDGILCLKTYMRLSAYDKDEL